ncbi:Stromal cell-derived factor 1 [Merluccius polli]|uniref:Stromal cell-derived factor 1 n=1 Tax=Merluccius polli TaxID=89951 RepID=A0AA47NUL4_MERPO|nr:Stromal cell-derived factor 1 [Merluccius polli]
MYPPPHHHIHHIHHIHPPQHTLGDHLEGRGRGDRAHHQTPGTRHLLSTATMTPKPISLVERCYCRSTVNSLPRGIIRELRFIQSPNCPFQVIAKLKTNKEVCVDPDMPWLQHYLKNAIRRLAGVFSYKLIQRSGGDWKVGLAFKGELIVG